MQSRVTIPENMNMTPHTIPNHVGNILGDWHAVLRVFKYDCQEFQNLSPDRKKESEIVMHRQWRGWRGFCLEQRMDFLFEHKCATDLICVVVEERGASSIIKLLLDHYRVDVNLQSSKGETIFLKAVKSGVVDNIEVFLRKDGDGAGPANVNSERSLTCKKSTPLLAATSLPPARFYCTSSRGLVDRSVYIIRRLLDLNSAYSTNLHGIEYPDVNEQGRNIWCLAAASGNSDVIKMLLDDSRKRRRYADLNQPCEVFCRNSGSTRTSMTPLLSVTQIVPTTTNPDPRSACRPLDGRPGTCTKRNCNVTIISLLIDNGANPLLTTRIHGPELGSSPEGMDLCPLGQARVGMLMYKRVQHHRIVVMRCLQKVMYEMHGSARELAPEIIRYICQLAGIGAMFVKDPKTPWVPCMPPRDSEASPAWRHAYMQIDIHVQEKRQEREIQTLPQEA